MLRHFQKKLFGADQTTLDKLKGVTVDDVAVLEVEVKPMQWHSGVNIFNDTDMSKHYTYNQSENEWRIFNPSNIINIRSIA